MNEILIAILTAIIGGLVGTYFGARFLNMREESKMKEVRAIAIKALDVLKKYSKQSYRNAENDFNTSLSLVEKRTVLVALHKLGIPIGIPSDEAFNIRKVYFVDTMIDEDVIEDIIIQVRKGYCDHLFYLDPDKHFTATGIYYRGKWFWYSWACEDLLYEYGNSKADAVDEDVEIIAWMPLPEPYKEKEE